MFSLLPKNFTLTLSDGKEIDLTLDEAQELCAVLMTALSPTLEPMPEKSTEEAAPLIPPTLTSATTMQDATTNLVPAQ